MSGLTSLTLTAIVADPGGSTMVVAGSILRNVAAEAWFYGQLIIALSLGLGIDILRRRDLKQRYGSRSVRVDALYALFELTHVVQFVVLLPAALLFTRVLQQGAPWLEIRALAALPAWLQLLVLFVFTDLWVYWWHRLQHRSKIVWQFHKTHHSQTHLNVMTGFRNTVIDRIVTLAILAIPAAIMKVDAVMPVTIAAVLQFHQLVIHSDSGWSFRWLERIFVSPSFHEVHHSVLQPHLDKNFGGVLSIWDRLFGTYAPRGGEALRYGLVGECLPETWLRQQLVPILGLWRLIADRARPRPTVGQELGT